MQLVCKTYVSEFMLQIRITFIKTQLCVHLQVSVKSKTDTYMCRVKMYAPLCLSLLLQFNEEKS